MSESMTVEQAIDLFRNYDYSNWFVDAGRMLADEVETLQKRVAVRGELCRALEASKQHVEQERDELRRRVAELIHYPDCWDQICYPTIERALENIDHLYQGCTECAEKSKARIKAEAVREFGQWSDNQARSDWYGRTASDMAQTYANQIEGGA